MENEEKKLLILHLLMVLLETIALASTISLTHAVEFKYYTEDSNILMLIVSLIFIYFIVRRKAIPKWLEILHHMAVLGLTVTFIVVVLVLAPMYKFNYSWIMFSGPMLYFHTLCPILAIVTYLFFSKTKIEKKYLPHTMIFTIIYSIILLILNICRVIEGPYPFIMVYKQSVIASILWIILIEGGAFLISWGLYKLKDKIK